MKNFEPKFEAPKDSPQEMYLNNEQKLRSDIAKALNANNFDEVRALINNLEKVVKRKESNTPLYLESPERARDQMRQMLTQLEDIFSNLERITPSHSQLQSMYQMILRGETGNTGLKWAILQLGKLDPRNLEAFSDWFLIWTTSSFSQLIRLYAFSRIPAEIMNTKTSFSSTEGDRSVVEDIEQAYSLLVRTVQDVLGGKINIPRLFEEDYDSEKYIGLTEDKETIKQLFPDALDAITSLPSGKIYDLGTFGLHSELMGIDRKPSVVYKR